MNLEEILNIYRKEICDETGKDANKLVKEWQAILYANEAEKEACRRARLLIDSRTAEVCNISIADDGHGVFPEYYALHPSIIYVRRATLASNGRRLKKALTQDLDPLIQNWESMEGEIYGIVMNMQSGYVRPFKKPLTADTIKLTVVRTPLTPMAKFEDTPEIPERYHYGLIAWMKKLTYGSQDSELKDENKEKKYDDLFTAQFGPCPPAVVEFFDELNYPEDDFQGEW